MKAISDTTVLLFLHRIEALQILPVLFDEVVVPASVAGELDGARKKGYDVPAVPDPATHWMRVAEETAETLHTDAQGLGDGETGVLTVAGALGASGQSFVVLLDDRRAREVARSEGYEVWGTLRVLLEAKRNGHLGAIRPFVDRLEEVGMWMSADLRQRILRLAGEGEDR